MLCLCTEHGDHIFIELSKPCLGLDAAAPYIQKTSREQFSLWLEKGNVNRFFLRWRAGTAKYMRWPDSSKWNAGMKRSKGHLPMLQALVSTELA